LYLQASPRKQKAAGQCVAPHLPPTMQGRVAVHAEHCAARTAGCRLESLGNMCGLYWVSANGSLIHDCGAAPPPAVPTPVPANAQTAPGLSPSGPACGALVGGCTPFFVGITNAANGREGLWPVPCPISARMLSISPHHRDKLQIVIVVHILRWFCAHRRSSHAKHKQQLQDGTHGQLQGGMMTLP
jgi:hypothetical protein